MTIDSALALIDSVANDRVLFIGDRIMDEYHYTRPLGKSPKEYLIPVQYQRAEIFNGGVIAAANHARSFVREVVVTHDGRMTRKVRFIDDIYFRKLFEVQYSEDETLEDIGQIEGEWDAVIVTDFGHGAIDGAVETNGFLAVAAQTNASNIGYNLITKYPAAHYIVIDEPEARLAAGDREGAIEDVILKLSVGRCPKFVVTLGRNGAIGWDGKFHYSPAIGDGVLDTMGAGDAFFAVTAPMARHLSSGFSMDDLLLIGNAAGALKTHIIGHRKPVTKGELIDFLKQHG